MEHVWDAPDAPFMRPESDGVELRPLVAPARGERVIEKSEPNASALHRARDNDGRPKGAVIIDQIIAVGADGARVLEELPTNFWEHDAATS